MLIYFSTFIICFIFDKLKNKIIAKIFHNGTSKLIKYTKKFHDDEKTKLEILLDWILI